MIALFLASFVAVFAQAFQSKSVNGGHYLLAASGSVFIAASQALVWRAVAPESSGIAEVMVYAAGGATGVICAMFTHNRFVKGKKHG